MAMTLHEETIVVVEAPAMRGPNHGRNDMMTALTDAVRENPVSAALIGMGALWLFAGGGNVPLFGGRGRQSLAGAVAQGAGSVAHGASDMAQSAAHAASRMGQSVASGVSSAVGGFAETVGDTASRMGDYVGSSLHDVDAQAAYRNPRFSHDRGEASLRSSMTGMTSSLQDMLERHPVALGVAGLALGAAVAASLPLTETERDTLGKANETMRSRLGEVAEQAKDMAAAAAAEVSSGGAQGPG
jgi:hypothetical protein